MNAPSILLAGAKGGGRNPPPPKEAPDDLLVDATAYIIDVLSEGEIEGWATPEAPAKSIYFDGVPLQNEAGDFNFEGVEFTLRTGTESQEPPGTFPRAQSEAAVGLKVEQATPVVRTVTDPDVDDVRVAVGTPQLTTFKDNGDLEGGEILFAVDVQEGAGAWVLGVERRIAGKTTSGYEHRIRIKLPPTRPVNVRVRRISPDSASAKVQNDLFFVSFTEIFEAKLEYPGTAYVAISFPAETFGGRVPRRSYAIKGLKCLVPSNYNPATRAYVGIWDGTFVRAHTDNPAWAWYTALVDERWGLGERIEPGAVDKWALYAIAQYCDEAVDDGKGGTEPRFTFNGPLDRQENAIEVLRMIASAFRGATYWSAGAVVPVADRPSDPVKLVTNANVEEITYSGVPLSARHSVAIVSTRDPEDHYAIKPTAVHDDAELIRRFGRRQRDVTLPFCTSDGEGLRAAKWIVETDGRGGERASWRAGFDHAGLRPGDAVLLSDKHRIGQRLGGRVLEIVSATQVRLDSPVPAALSAGLKIYLSTAGGNIVERNVAASSFAGVSESAVLTLTAALPRIVNAAAIWFVASDDVAPRRFKVLANAFGADNRFTISAVEEDPGKWARVEQGLIVDRAPPYLLPPTGAPSAPAGLQVLEWARARPGGRAQPFATLGWTSPADPRVESWQWAAKEPGAAWSAPVRVYTTAADIPLQSGIVNGYRFRVRAVTVDGQISAWAAVDFDPVGAGDPPPAPTGLAVEGQAFRNVVSWTLPDVDDFRFVNVLAGPTPDSADAVFLASTAATSFAHEGLGFSETWYYWVRTWTHAETKNFSALAGPVPGTTLAALTPAEITDALADAADTAEAAETSAAAALAAASANGASITQLQTEATALEAAFLDGETTNALRNSNFALDTDYWHLNGATAGYQWGRRALNSIYSGPNELNRPLFVRRLPGEADQSADLIATLKRFGPAASTDWGVPVQEGRRIEISARVGAFNCQARLLMQFRDAAGAFISNHFSDWVTTTGPGGPGTNPRLWLAMDVPAGATRGIFAMNMGASVNPAGDAYAILYRPQLCESPAGATKPQPYAPGSSATTGAVDAWFRQDTGVLAGEGLAVAQDVVSQGARIDDAEAAITTINTTKVTAAEAVAAVSSEISASTGGGVASVSDLALSHADLDGDVRAARILAATADIAGGGKRVALVALGATPDTSFLRFDANLTEFLTDKFRVLNPSGGSPKEIFSVSGGEVFIGTEPLLPGAVAYWFAGLGGALNPTPTNVVTPAGRESTVSVWARRKVRLTQGPGDTGPLHCDFTVFVNGVVRHTERVTLSDGLSTEAFTIALQGNATFNAAGTRPVALTTVKTGEGTMTVEDWRLTVAGAWA